MARHIFAAHLTTGGGFAAVALFLGVLLFSKKAQIGFEPLEQADAAGIVWDPTRDGLILEIQPLILRNRGNNVEVATVITAARVRCFRRTT